MLEKTGNWVDSDGNIPYQYIFWGRDQPNGPAGPNGTGAYWTWDGDVFDTNADLSFGMRVICVQEVVNHTGKLFVR